MNLQDMEDAAKGKVNVSNVETLKVNLGSWLLSLACLPSHRGCH